MSATPRPWRCQPEENNAGTWEVLAPRGECIADSWPGDLGYEAAEANAHLIVRAVNSHDDLLAAAKEARDELSQYTARWCEELAAKLDEAIEKAEQ